MQEVSHNMQTIAYNKQSLVRSNRRSLKNINTSSHLLNKYEVTLCVCFVRTFLSYRLALLILACISGISYRMFFRMTFCVHTVFCL